jgi:hypothetical protein
MFVPKSQIFVKTPIRRFIFLVILQKCKRHGDERDDEYHKRHPSGNLSLWVKGRLPVDNRRVSESEGKEEYSPDKPSFPDKHPHKGENNDKSEGKAPLFFSEERIGDMPSVELTDRDQVHRSDEKADPAGKCDRTQKDVVICRRHS